MGKSMSVTVSHVTNLKTNAYTQTFEDCHCHRKQSCVQNWWTKREVTRDTEDRFNSKESGGWPWSVFFVKVWSLSGEAQTHQASLKLN